MNQATDSPFLRVTGPSGAPLPWVLVRAPLVTRGHHVHLARLAEEGCRFAGMTSYLGFPGAGYRDERDYGALCEAWLHCFRDPDRYLPPTGPRALVSESDFTDPHRVDPRLAARTLPAELVADVVYVCGSPIWKQDAKNWPLAARCLPRLARDGLRVVVVDAPAHARPISGVHLHGSLEWSRLLAAMAGARCVFVPSVLDASPRVLAEALCLDVPVVVNRDILGGWKYVNRFTGAFFHDEDDVVSAVREVVGIRRHPRSWFTAHHGPVRAGRRILDVLRALDPALLPLTHVLLESEREPAGCVRRATH